MNPHRNKNAAMQQLQARFCRYCSLPIGRSGPSCCGRDTKTSLIARLTLDLPWESGELF